MNTDRDKLFELFHPIAQMEARKICREFGSYMRLYEADDLVNWADVSEFWPRYKDNTGAMRYVIRFAMLRALAMAQDYGKDVEAVTLDLQHGVPYNVAKSAGLIDKNQPTNRKDFDRRISPDEIQNRKAEDPVMQAILNEMKAILDNKKIFDKRDRDILLRRVCGGEPFSDISRSTGVERHKVRASYDTVIWKLRRML